MIEEPKQKHIKKKKKKQNYIGKIKNIKGNKINTNLNPTKINKRW